MAFTLAHADYFPGIEIYNHLGFYRMPLFYPNNTFFVFFRAFYRAFGNIHDNILYGIIIFAQRFLPGKAKCWTSPDLEDSKLSRIC
jgi:hypothetical protein